VAYPFYQRCLILAAIVVGKQSDCMCYCNSSKCRKPACARRVLGLLPKWIAGLNLRLRSGREPFLPEVYKGVDYERYGIDKR